MGYFTKIRCRIGYRKLNALSGGSVSSRQLINLRSSRSIGVLCTPSGALQLEEAIASVQILPAKDISMMVWFGEENRVRNLILPPWVKELTPDDLDFYYLPKSQKALTFMNTPFDVLMVLDQAEELPVRGLIQLSKARCRIGVRMATSPSHYDFAIIPKESDSYASLVEHMMQYSRCFPSL